MMQPVSAQLQLLRKHLLSQATLDWKHASAYAKRRRVSCVRAVRGGVSCQAAACAAAWASPGRCASEELSSLAACTAQQC